MTAQIVFNGMNINYIIEEIKVDNPQGHNTSPYIGSVGSRTDYASSEGRVLSFKNLCRVDEESPHGRGHRINDYIWLAKNYNQKEAVLTSPSDSNLDGNYILTKFDYTEDTGGNFVCEWELKEQIPFNVTSKTFRVWGKSVSSDSKAKNTTANKLDSNTMQLLGFCGLLTLGSNSDCVKCLQKFLQKNGYFTKEKVTGRYQKPTFEAVKSLQKANKLKATGFWDSDTRAYFQKKYKYPVDITPKNNSPIKSVTNVKTFNKVAGSLK